MAIISINNLASAIYDSSKDKSGSELERVLGNSVNLLAQKHMLGKAPQIINRLEEIIDKEEEVVCAKLISKVKLNKKIEEEVVQIIKKKYKAKEVILTLSQDEKLLGGVKIEVGDEVINMTLRHKLEKLQSYLNAN